MAKHRAAAATELEALAKKFDRFGWDRDRGTAAQDRIITDWMDALQDFPLHEIRAACKRCVLDNPNRMPNEGHVRAAILEARRDAVARLPRQPEPDRNVQPVTQKAATEILERAGFRPKGMGDTVMAALRDRGASGYLRMASDAIRTAADAANVPPAEVAGDSRRPDIVRARWAAMADLRDRGLGLSEIGRALGMDHTTVRHGLTRHDAGDAA